MKRRFRNQPDRLWHPIRVALRVAAGPCPSCVFLGEPGGKPAVIYRRSRYSITYRCPRCSLQWTVTFAVLHRVATKRLAKGLKDPHMAAVYETIAEATKFTVEREAKRKSTITRQKNRRVIRLPDSMGK